MFFGIELKRGSGYWEMGKLKEGKREEEEEEEGREGVK